MTIRRIVSMDGGPASGSWVRCLRDIAREHPALLMQADLFAGTSAGAFAAAWLAKHLPVSPSAADVHKTAEALVEASNELLMLLTPDSDGYGRLITGKGAMVLDDDLVKFLERPEVLGKATTLAQLSHKVVLVASRTNTPWAPHVHTNFGPDAEPHVRVVDAVMRSTAFPLLLPGWQSHADGAMFVNNPAAVALAWARHGEGVDASTRVISFGGDDGSSAISNLATPHDTDEDTTGTSDGDDASRRHPAPVLHALTSLAPKGLIERAEDAVEDVTKLVTGAAAKLGHKVAAAVGVGSLEAAEEAVEDALAETSGGLSWAKSHGRFGPVMTRILNAANTDVVAEREAVEQIGRAAEEAQAMEQTLQERLRELNAELHVHMPEELARDEVDNWGWRAWLAYLFNPVYAMQVFLNSQGRGTHEVVRRLLEPGCSLRVAPVAMVPTNVILLAMILAQPDLAKEAGQRTAALWSNPLTNALLDFETSTADVRAFMAGWGDVG